LPPARKLTTYLPMTTRVFLGWDGPFLPKVAAWLLDQTMHLPQALVVVPTSQSGRRLREALALQAGGALLTPKIVTPGILLDTPDPAVATEWMERLAWMEVLDHITDWEVLEDLFPEPPEATPEWSGGFASDLTSLRRTLQQNGHTLTSAARIFSKSIECARWEALARLENRMERLLEAWSLRSRSRVLAAGVHLPDKRPSAHGMAPSPH
jgi:ATP-dependent helicase/nuclease subunit B